MLESIRTSSAFTSPYAAPPILNSPHQPRSTVTAETVPTHTPEQQHITPYEDTPLASPAMIQFETQAPQTTVALNTEALAEQALSLLQQRAQSPAFSAILEQVYPQASAAQRNALINEIRSGTLDLPSIEFVSPEILQGNLGAYSDTGRIFLNTELQTNPPALELVLLQEIGHHLDHVLDGTDSPGDEGLAFSLALLKNAPLSEEELSLTRGEHDHGNITIDGETLVVEHAGPLIPIGIWVGKAVAATTLDAAIGAAIGAVTGVPPTWLDTAIDFGINLVTPPGVRQAQKVGELVRAIDNVSDALRRIDDVPGAQRLLQNISRAKDEMLDAINNGNLDLFKRKFQDLIGYVREAQIASTLRSQGSEIVQAGRNVRRNGAVYTEIDVVSRRNGELFFDQVKSGGAANHGRNSNSWERFERQARRTAEVAQENNASVRYFVDEISEDARALFNELGIEIIENSRFLR